MPKIIKARRVPPPPVSSVVKESVQEENTPVVDELSRLREEVKRRLEVLIAGASELTLLVEETAVETKRVKESIQMIAKETVDKFKDEIVRAVEDVALKQVNRETTLAAVREALSAAAEMKNAELAVPEDVAKEVAAAVEDLKVKAVPFLKEGDCVVEAEEKVLDNRALTRLKDALAALRKAVRKGGEEIANLR